LQTAARQQPCPDQQHILLAPAAPQPPKGWTPTRRGYAPERRTTCRCCFYSQTHRYMMSSAPNARAGCLAQCIRCRGQLSGPQHARQRGKILGALACTNINVYR
jgi:hypothetical protein